MKYKHTLTTIVLIGGATLAYFAILWIAYDHPKRAAAPAATSEVATTTEATTTPEVTQTKPTTKPKQETTTPAAAAPTYTAPQPTYTQPPIIINNTNTQTNPPQNEPATGNAEPFIEPREMTPLEIATDIVHLYDSSGTAELYGDNAVRVRAFNGKSVTVDLTQGWEERLKLTLNKIK